jgi:hypothetical protein
MDVNITPEMKSNMMRDRDYRPYCRKCEGVVRLGNWRQNDLICTTCNSKTTFNKDFVKKYKQKHF